FKQKIHHANYNESECQLCGNVNPEQVFNIVESNVLDEYGKITQKRKITPPEWYQFHQDEAAMKKKKVLNPKELPRISFKIPNKLKQFRVFATRDILSKLANSQYLVINFLEAPLLSFILSFLIKYYDVSESNEYGYTLMGNSNIPVYIFMAVIVAIFMGLTVSAEEIIKDRKILKREAFLNLSWSSFLLSKVGVLLILSAIQSFSFVIIGNTILEIKGMNLHYWILLFSCWVTANILGLVISDSFKTVVTIYILIPFLVIPQIILSGIIVKYEKLNPSVSSPDKIPFYGEIISARWGYEALAVHQFVHNEYMEDLYHWNKIMSKADYKNNYWYSNLTGYVEYIERNLENEERKEKTDAYLLLLKNEITKELANSSKIKFEHCDKLTREKVNKQVLNAAQQYLNTVKRLYIRAYNKASDKKDELIREKQKLAGDKSKFNETKRKHHNDKLTEFVKNSNEPNKIIAYKGELIQKVDPIYLDPEKGFVKAHFYAPRKLVFGYPVETFWVNVGVIWFMSFIFYLILYFRMLKGIVEIAEHTNRKYSEIKQSK
ncbi:MAG: ABC transporter permease, partial [Bacteroidales bacterium]|nr:ABC transporter permease [Bacteroidales bacterium]